MLLQLIFCENLRRSLSHISDKFYLISNFIKSSNSSLRNSGLFIIKLLTFRDSIINIDLISSSKCSILLILLFLLFTLLAIISYI